MPRDPGLMGSGDLDEGADLVLAVAQRLDDATPGRVGENLEEVHLHFGIYTPPHIYWSRPRPGRDLAR